VSFLRDKKEINPTKNALSILPDLNFKELSKQKNKVRFLKIS